MLIIIYIENTHPNEKLNIPFGGVQSQVSQLIKSYTEIKNLRLTLITRYSEYQDNVNNFRVFQFHKFNNSILDKLYFYVKSLYKIVKIHNREQIHLINVHTFSYNMFIPLILRLIYKVPILIKIPIDFNSHINEVSLMTKKRLLKKIVCFSWLKLFQKILIKKIDFIRVINNQMFEELTKLNFPEKQILTIPNGIELKSENDIRKIPRDNVNFGFSGRITKFKNIRYMLNEFKDYFTLFPSDRLYIYGNGTELDNIICFIKQNNLRDNIVLPGFERQRDKIYQNLDVLIDPSYSQGISNANLEAMNTNTFLIASKVNGNVDLIIDGKTGLLFNPRKKGALLNKLIFYKEHPEQVREMITNARRKITEIYDIKFISQRIIDSISKSENPINNYTY